jgi:hypothetical protein
LPQQISNFWRSSSHLADEIRDATRNGDKEVVAKLLKKAKPEHYDSGDSVGILGFA